MLHSLWYRFVLIITLPIAARYVTGDTTGFFYIADQNNAITKIDSAGNKWFRYSDITNGNIYSIDASNPFRSIVFYKQQQVIQILDNNLGLVSTIQLRKNNLMNISATARSSDNNIWLYDAVDMNIKKINDYGKLVAVSADIFQLVGHTPQITFMTEENHKIFVCDTTSGIIVFDEYLNYEKTIPIKPKTQIQVVNQSLFYIEHNQITEYNLTTKAEQTDTLQDIRTFQSALLFRKFMITQEQNAVSLYRLTP